MEGNGLRHEVATRPTSHSKQIALLTKLSGELPWENQKIILSCLRQVRSSLDVKEVTAEIVSFTQSEHYNSVHQVLALLESLEKEEEKNVHKSPAKRGRPKAPADDMRPRVLKISCEVCEELFPDMRTAAIHVNTQHGPAITCDACLTTLYDVNFISSSCSPLRVMCTACHTEGNPEPEENSMAVHTGIKITDLTREHRRKSGPPRARNQTAMTYLHEGEPICNPDPLEVNPKNKKEEFVCIYCRRILPNLKRYKNHLMLAAGAGHQTTPPPCELCKRSFRNHQLKDYHVCGAETVCEHCDKKFECVSKLRRHLIVHTRDVAEVECRVCQQQFESVMECLKHGKEEHQAEAKCDVCRTTKDFPEFAAECTGARAYCNNCSASNLTPGQEPKEFSAFDKAGTNSYVQINIQKVPIDIRARRFELEEIRCEVCDVLCKGKYDYRKHCESIKHQNKAGGNINWFECSVCSKTFSSEQRVKDHMDRMHSDKPRKPGRNAPIFNCGLCNAKVQSKEAYMNHIKGHLGVKDYPCEVCGARFKTEASRTQHRAHTHKRYHPAEEFALSLFKCWFCPKGFTKRKLSQKHMARSHAEMYHKEKAERYKAEAEAVQDQILTVIPLHEGDEDSSQHDSTDFKNPGSTGTEEMSELPIAADNITANDEGAGTTGESFSQIEVLPTVVSQDQSIKDNLDQLFEDEGEELKTEEAVKEEKPKVQNLDALLDEGCEMAVIEIPEADTDAELIATTTADAELAATTTADAELTATTTADAELTATTTADAELTATTTADAELTATTTADAELTATTTADAELNATTAADAELNATTTVTVHVPIAAAPVTPRRTYESRTRKRPQTYSPELDAGKSSRRK